MRISGLGGDRVTNVHWLLGDPSGDLWAQPNVLQISILEAKNNVSELWVAATPPGIVDGPPQHCSSLGLA